MRREWVMDRVSVDMNRSSIDVHTRGCAVCCSVLQCVEVCCSVVQCGAVWCSVLQFDTVWSIVIQCDAVWCSVMQCDAVWCSVMQCHAACCSVLQRVAECCCENRRGRLLSCMTVWTHKAVRTGCSVLLWKHTIDVYFPYMYSLFLKRRAAMYMSHELGTWVTNYVYESWIQSAHLFSIHVQPVPEKMRPEIVIRTQIGIMMMIKFYCFILHSRYSSFPKRWDSK